MYYYYFFLRVRPGSLYDSTLRASSKYLNIQNFDCYENSTCTSDFWFESSGYNLRFHDNSTLSLAHKYLHFLCLFFSCRSSTNKRTSCNHIHGATQSILIQYSRLVQSLLLLHPPEQVLQQSLQQHESTPSLRR